MIYPRSEGIFRAFDRIPDIPFRRIDILIRFCPKYPPAGTIGQRGFRSKHRTADTGQIANVANEIRDANEDHGFLPYWRRHKRSVKPVDSERGNRPQQRNRTKKGYHFLSNRRRRAVEQGREDATPYRYGIAQDG